MVSAAVQELLVWLRQRAGTVITAAQVLPLAPTTHHPTLAATPAVEWPATFQALRPTGNHAPLMARTPTATLDLAATRVTAAATLVVG